MILASRVQRRVAMRFIWFGLLAASSAWAQPSLSNLTVSWKQTFEISGGYNLVVNNDGSSYFFARAPQGLVPTNPPYGSTGSPSVVIKLDASGNPIWSTLLHANISSLAVDGFKNIYLSGNCDGATFPTTPDAFQTHLPGTQGFVAKLNTSGQVQWATQLGGQDGSSFPSAVAADESGIYVGGSTQSLSFPTTPGAFQQTAKTSDPMPQPVLAGFITKLNTTGSGLVFSTFLGGTSSSTSGSLIDSIAIDSGGAVYAAGRSLKPDFPLTPGAYRTSGNIFLSKLAADGSRLKFSTFVDESFYAIALRIDTAGSSYVMLQRPAKVIKIDATGSTALYSYQIDTNSLALFLHLALDSDGNAVVSGSTLSADIPVPAPCFADSAGSPAANMDFLLRLDSSSGEIIDGGYLFLQHTNSDFTPFGLDFAGNVYVADAEYQNASYVVRKFVPGPASGRVQLRCVANSATLAKAPVAPGEILALFGDGIGPDQAANLHLDPSGKVTSLLADTEVQFDGMAAPILYAQSRQINVVAPWEIAGRSSTRICVIYQGTTTNCITVPVSEVSPGFFRNASGFIAALNQDGTINSLQNPARIGSIVTLFVTGIGPAVPPEVDGEVIQDIRGSALTVKASMFRNIGVLVPTIIPVTADIIFHGPAPALVSGVEVVQIRVPSYIDTGDIELDMQSSAGLQYSDRSSIAIVFQ